MRVRCGDDEFLRLELQALAQARLEILPQRAWHADRVDREEDEAPAVRVDNGQRLRTEIRGGAVGRPDACRIAAEPEEFFRRDDGGGGAGLPGRGGFGGAGGEG